MTIESIEIRRSGYAFHSEPPLTASLDTGYLLEFAAKALARGESVELRLGSGPWHPVRSLSETQDVVSGFFREIDAARANPDQGMLL